VVLAPTEMYRITVGAEGQLHYEVEQRAADDTGAFLDDTGGDARPYQIGAAYLLADARPAPAFRASGGVRLDAYSTFGTSLNRGSL